MGAQYTQDVEFNSDFGALQTPVHICTAAMLCGYDGVNINGSFRYLDIACGNGHTLSILADAYPQAEFVGIDINPAHIAKASELARQAGLTNVQFIEGDIANLAPSGFQPFDICTVSGVYSWLDAQRQAQLLDAAEQLVRPGGLFYLDYSAMPGGAQTAPLYQMIQKLSGQFAGNSADKLTGASHLLSAIRDGGGQFFEQNEQANQRLLSILANPAEDEAHEVLNMQPHGLWSADVISSLAEKGFSFLGSAGLQHNLPELSAHLPKPKTATELSITSQQLLQDVAWNVAQRKDIYLKGEYADSKPLITRLQDYGFYIAPGALDDQNVAFVLKQFPGANLITRTHISQLNKGRDCQTFAELTKHFHALGLTDDTINRLFSQLLATRIVSLAQPLLKTDKQGSALSMPSALNRLMLEQDIHLEQGRPFASSTIGSRLLLPIKDRLYLWALVIGDVGSAWEKLGDLRNAFHGPNGQPLNKGEFVNIIQQSLPAFKAKVVPELVRLGILR
ncbi:MAG: methyltransferase domain-containing protein [Paraglaciecola sp.]